MAAFFATFYGHAMLWSVGIRHGDISEGNLVWDPEEKVPKLCDFDLSHFCEPPQIGVAEKRFDRPMGHSNTGTWIFMADELLTRSAMEGWVKRVYRHEVEAFVAVLVWIACRYKDGELREDRSLEHWQQGNYFVVKGLRAVSFDEITTPGPNAYAKPSGLPDLLWDLISDTILSMVDYNGKLDQVMAALKKFESGRRNRSAPTEQPEDYDTLHALHKMLSWEVFEHSSAELFVKLMKERVPSNPNEQQRTKA